MKRKTCLVKGEFNGMYTNSNGMTLACALNWVKFWRSYKGIMWRVLEYKYSGSVYFQLVSTSSAIYLHPSGFTCVLSDTLSICTTALQDMADELQKVCTDCAKACGGTFTLAMSNKICVEYEFEKS